MSYVANLLPRLAGIFDAGPERNRLVVLAHARHVSKIRLPASIQVVSPTDPSMAGLKRLAWESLNLRKVCTSVDAQVLFVPNQVSTPVSGVRSVLMLRNMEPFGAGDYPYSLRGRVRNLALSWLTPRCLRRAKRVIAVSDYVADFAASELGVARDRVCAIPHGRDPGFSPDAGLSDVDALRRHGVREPYLLICGSLLPYRRVEDAIQALVLARERLERIPDLVVAGTSDQRRYIESLQESARQAGLSDHVRLIGQVTRADMAPLYRRALMVIMSTEIEACPNVAIEAMSSGCPVVSSDIPALRAILADAAIYYSRRDSSRLADAICSVVTSPELRAKLGAASLRRSKAFDWDVAARETYRALTEW